MKFSDTIHLDGAAVLIKEIVSLFNWAQPDELPFGESCRQSNHGFNGFALSESLTIYLI